MDGFVIGGHAPWPLGRFATLQALDGVVHAVTTRAGPDFGPDALTPACAQAAAATAAALGLRAAAWVRQVHGATVLRATSGGLCGEADALVCDTPGLGVLGRSADCPLVLVAGRRTDGRGAVGFAHASWRSTVAGVTAAMLDRLTGELGVLPASIVAAIAPSAGACCYEVGDEVVAAAHAALGPDADTFFTAPGSNGRRRFDLLAANRAQLAAAGVPTSRVADSGVCTICRGERFWSWRRERQTAGRFAAVIGLGAAFD